ncbi:MAG: WhiB family transcriptional regulator [Nocardioides sp.]|nr:WhiB family transcriptional regulator [Nocardioides sp.]
MTTRTTEAPVETPCLKQPDRWFAERNDDLQAAKQECGMCPVRTACLLAALERAEPWGVWGGEIFVDGTVVEVKHGRGRPPKHRPHGSCA